MTGGVQRAPVKLSNPYKDGKQTLKGYEDDDYLPQVTPYCIEKTVE